VSERVVLDFDATLVTAHFDKSSRRATTRAASGSFAAATCGREALAEILRPITADDDIEVLGLRWRRCPREILARADGAGASHAFAQACRETDAPLLVGLRLGFAIRPRVREAVRALGKRPWTPTADQDGERCEGVWVAGLTEVDMSTSPRPVDRWRECPRPNAQLSFTDVDDRTRPSKPAVRQL